MRPIRLSLVILLACVTAKKICHCLPEDDCWPSELEWDQLNSTVNGVLVEVTPIGAVCHDPTYDEGPCSELKNHWDDVSTHYKSLSSLMTAYFTNETCDPFTDRSQPCTIGNYNAYTVDATTRQQIVDTLEFSRRHNIRFIIRNTGHDFWGRSIGYGGLAVRVSNLKSQELLDWKDREYEGLAFKIGAGVMGFEAQETLEKHGYVMVAGYCPSVSLAGGYVQGAGHSPLSTMYGLAADQTLEFEVITATGKVIKASRRENEDLFWALNGGGAGTWGVVVSMTVRIYPLLPMSAASLFIDPKTMRPDTFWAMVDKFYSLLPYFTDNGAYITYAYGQSHFGTFPLSAYNKTAEEVEELMYPFIEYLNGEGIQYMVAYSSSPTYLEHVQANFATSQPTKEWPSGGRIIPRIVFEDNKRRAEFVSVMRRIVSEGALTSSTVMRPIQRTDNPTSVHPAWRDMDALVIMTWPWENAEKDLMRQKVELFANELSPLLIEIAPDGASYSNEADAFMREWRHEMYGPHWERLLKVKEKWDPEGVFYSRHTPGEDMWHLDMDTRRMCKMKQGSVTDVEG